jgi:hypothetical protein
MSNRLSRVQIDGQQREITDVDIERLITNDSKRAQLPVRGQGEAEQGFKASVDPGESEMQEMVDTLLTPPHPDALEPLLNTPCTSTFDHPAAQRQAQILIPVRGAVLTMPLQRSIHGPHGLPGCLRHSLAVSGLHQVGQHPVRHAVPQTVPCPATPPVRLGRPPIQPSGRALPSLLRGRRKVHKAPCMTRAALFKEAPHPTAPVAEPAHRRRALAPLAQRCEPEPRREGGAIPHDRYQPPLHQPSDDLPGPRVLLAQAGAHAHCDCAPAGVPRGCSGLRPQRDPHASGPQGQGQSHRLGRQWLGPRPVVLGHGGQVFLEGLHGLVASRWPPTPDGSGTDGAPAVPAEQPGRSGTRHQDRAGTAQGLQRTTAPLRRRHPQCLIARRDRRDGTALGTAANPTAPPEWSKQARELTRGTALTPQRDAAYRAAGPGAWTMGAFGQHGCDEADGEPPGHLPRRQDEYSQGVGICDGMQKTLHRRIIVASAVVQA